MIYNEDMSGNRTVERIIRERGEKPAGGADSVAEIYEAYERTENMPHMGFSLFQRGGARHGFFYHSIDNLDLIEDRKHGEFLRFTHRGKAVTMRGRGLHDVFDAIMDHTLRALYEFDEVWEAPDAEACLIDRVQVDSLEDMAAMAARNMSEARQ